MTIVSAAVGAIDVLSSFVLRKPTSCEASSNDSCKDGSSGGLPWLTISASVGTLILVGVMVSRVKSKRRAAAAQLRLPGPQEPKLELKEKPLPPGKGSPIFHGIRILELATHVAAPTVGRVMAELGAEVIKIEAPSGDIFRDTILAFEAPRKFGTAFENSNVGKYSICIDLKTEEGIAHFKELIEEADVFVTNVRQAALVGMGLDSAAICAEFPHVVYGQVSAWGPTGPDAQKAGFDLGAFFTGTGFAASMNKRGGYSNFPGAFGDFTTGQGLISGVTMALTRRLRTGKGGFVHISLLRSGVWCVSPAIADAVAKGIESKEKFVKDGQVPDYHSARCVPTPLERFYETSDGHRFVMATAENAVDRQEKLCKIYELPLKEGESLTHETLKDVFENMPLAKVSATLNAMLVDVFVVRPTEDISRGDVKTLPELNDMFHMTDDKEAYGGSTQIPKVTYQFSCSKAHTLKTRAPVKGAHTDVIKKDGWDPIHYKSVLPRAEEEEETNSEEDGVLVDVDSQKATTGPLDGLVVIELSNGIDSCISATACSLADHGALVIKIEDTSKPAGGDSLRQTRPRFFEQLNRGKKSVSMDLSNSMEAQQVMGLALQADVLLTDKTDYELRGLSLDFDILAQIKPSLVVVQLSSVPSSSSKKHLATSMLGPMMAESTLSRAFTLASPEVTHPYPHMLENAAAFHVLSGTCAAVFHQQRTGEGQMVNVNYLHIGVWNNSLALTWANFRPANLINYDTLWQSRNWYPLATFNSYTTKDGMEIQLLGLDIKRHMMRTLAALGIKSKTFRNLFGAWWSKVRPNKAEKTMMIKLRPIFEVLNGNINTAIESLTYAEIKERFAKFDVWYTPVRVPVQLLSYEQAHATGVFVRGAEASGGVGERVDLFVANPIALTSDVNGLAVDNGVMAKAPGLGEHNDMSVEQMKE